MSKDDPKRPPDHDPAYITMPPELRPYVRKLDNKVIRPGDDPIFDAAKAALLKLNTGPNEDALYYDVKKEQAEIRARMGVAAPGIGNVSASVTLTEVPAAPAGVVDGGGTVRVVIAGSDEKPQEAASPWSKEAAAVEVRASALPSSLRPRETATVVGARLGAQAARERVRGTVIVVALAVVALGISVAVLRRGTENGAREAAPSATPTAPAPSVPEVAPAPMEAVAPPAVSATASAAVHAAPSVVPAPEWPRVAPKAPSPVDDPYKDAAVTPPPAVTAVPPKSEPTAPPLETNAPKAPAPVREAPESFLHKRPE
jgi:hypothetical protein